MKKIAIVQARMGSTRLPNKSLLKLHGYPICEWVYIRLKKSKLLDEILFAIPETKENDILYNFLKSKNISVYRGSEHDVLDRFYNAAKENNADIVIRICADNPLVCPDEIDNLINFFINSKCDYAYNHIPKGNNYPDGLGGEVCSLETLRTIFELAVELKDREHVFNFLLKHPKKFKIETFDAKPEISGTNIKLDIDTMDDFLKLSMKELSINMHAIDIVRLFRD